MNGEGCLCEFGRAAGAQPGGFKQWEFIVSQFWQLEIQDQGISKASFSQDLSSCLVGGHLPPVPSHHLPSAQVILD